MRQFPGQVFYRPANEDLRFLPECPRVLQNYPGKVPLLGWVSIQHGLDRRDGSINLLNLETGANTSFPVPGRPGFFVETTSPGVLLVGLDRRLVLVDATTGSIEETGIDVSSDERVIINDGIAIPNGLLFGTKELTFQNPVASVFHYDCASRALREILTSQICSNGKYFRQHEDHVTLVDIDSKPRTITEYQFDLSLRQFVTQPRLIAPAASLPAIPDGLKAAPGGDSIVVAFYNPESVDHGIAQEIRLIDGAILTEWRLPGSPRVTCPEFAIMEGKVRIIFTTAVEGMPAATRQLAKNAGALFWADTPFTELPERQPLFPIDSIR